MNSILASLQLNQKEVLNQIRIHKELSGAEIARITSLQPSTIVYIIKALTKFNLIEFSKTGSSTEKGGKKPILYRINPQTGIIVGMEILLKKIKIAVIDFSGHEILKKEESYPQRITEKNILGTIVSLITKLRLNKSQILGIGVAIPGVVNTSKGMVNYSRKIGLIEYELKKELEKELKTNVVIGNDANAGVLGYKWFPEYSFNNFQNVIYLVYNHDSSNIGSGIIINNRLYEGSSGGAGEIISSIPSFNELIEQSNDALLSSGKIHKEEKLPENDTFDDIMQKNKQGNTIAAHIIESLSLKLSRANCLFGGLSQSPGYHIRG